MSVFKPVAYEKNINIMIYGMPKVGKTTMVGTAVAGTDEKMAVLDCQGGIAPIAHLKKNIFVTSIRSYDGILKAYEEINGAVKRGKLQWVVIDHLTELQDVLMQEIKTETIRTSSGSRTAVRDRGRKDDWGINISRLKNIVRMFRDLPINTVFVALSKKAEDEDGESLMKPSFGGSSTSEEIAGYCDVVLYYRIARQVNEKGEVELHRFCSSSPTSGFIAGDRFGVLAANEEPNLRTIVQKIMAKE